MNDEASEPNSSVKGFKDWLSVVSMIVTLIVGTLLTGWVSLVDSKVNEARLAIDRYGATSNYLNLISAESSPVYLKSMALASMLRFDLMDPDLLFAAAYQAEDHQGPGILQQLLYEYAKISEPMEEPFGYVDLPGRLEGDSYRIQGWALDDRQVAKVEMLLDDQPVTSAPESYERRDVASLLTRYPAALHSGFRFKLPAADLKDRTLRLTVRVRDDDYHIMQILDTDVCFTGQEARRSTDGRPCGDPAAG